MPCDRFIVKVGRQFGKRHIELAQYWCSSAAIYGATLFTGIVYFTDWKVVASKIPIYNTKFKNN